MEPSLKLESKHFVSSYWETGAQPCHLDLAAASACIPPPLWHWWCLDLGLSTVSREARSNVQLPEGQNQPAPSLVSASLWYSHTALALALVS